ncbi:MAG: choice-of-anchor Q domain-containing protein, partial [Polyangiales bacterium]
MEHSLLSCVCALCVVPLVGCGETAGTGGSGGSAGTGGAGPGGAGGAGVDIAAVCHAALCKGAECQPIASRFPCTEQGIRDAIAAGGGPYGFDCDGPTTVVTEAELVIDNDVILDGEGILTLDGGEDHGLLRVAGGVSAELHGFTVSSGRVFGDPKGVGSSSGAGIHNDGELLLRSSTVSANETGAYANGGGIANFGTMTIAKSTVSENTAFRRGAGIYNRGEMTLCDSTVTGNVAQNGGGPTIGEGGGILNDRGALTLVNSTVSGNAAVDLVGEGGGTIGGIGNFGGTVTLANSTVSGNRAIDATGALYSSGGSVRAIGSLIDGDCSIDSTAEVSDGHNIESPGDTCGFDEDGDQVNVSAEELKLGPLQDNGGPTMTHALLPGSVAIDVIPAGDCEVDEDQRGEPRPGGTMCDVGAFEVEQGSL